MTPLKSKPQKIEQVENLLKAINQPYATLEQVTLLTKALIQSVNKVKESLNQENVAHREQIIRDMDSIVTSLVQNYNSVVSQIKKMEQVSQKRHKQMLEDMQRLIKQTEAKIPDTTYLMLKIEELEGREVEEYDDSAVLEGLNEIDVRIDELEDDIKKLRARNITSAGGSGILNIGHWPRHESFTMNGSDTSVTLTQAVAASGTALIVRYQGQTLDLTTHYTVDGNKITLVGFTPEVDTIISVTYWS